MTTSKMRQIEQAEGKPIREVLTELYKRYGSQAAVADRLGVSPGTISLWLIRLGMEHWTIVKPAGQEVMQ